MEEDSRGRYYSLERGAFSASECYPIAQRIKLEIADVDATDGDPARRRVPET